LPFITSPLFFKLLIHNRYHAFAFYPFIILKTAELKEDLVLVQHEQIHLKQQKELLLIPFYVVYFMEFAFHSIRLRNWHKAYKSISFEKEAFSHENELDYLNNRPMFAMWQRN
jgi:hypothetical protein